ncbi:MAG: hypothetical protein MUE74_12710 [Bacteroidales bacterium]|nr:hypothetical protein [Bacteroidales bacterium]
MQNIYNLEFDEAGEAYNSLAAMYPGHPVLNLFSGMKIYWENFPMDPSSQARKEFEGELRTCIEISGRDNFPSPGYEAEFLLANICARGLLLLYLSENDQSGEVIPLVTSSYRPLINTFRYTSSCPDFYYFTGVYNYYREAYPIVYPVYKAVAFMFPKGDMELGLKQLEECGKRSMALRAEAFVMLSWIRMNFEMNFLQALPYSKHLAEQYPENPLYRIYLAKNLLLLKRYDDAGEIVLSGRTGGENPFNNAVMEVFRGLIQEKKYRNLSSAAVHYRKGIDNLARFGPYAYEYVGYAYLGLSRISEAKGNTRESKSYHRKGIDLIDFKGITFSD